MCRVTQGLQCADIGYVLLNTVGYPEEDNYQNDHGDNDRECAEEYRDDVDHLGIQ